MDDRTRTQFETIDRLSRPEISQAMLSAVPDDGSPKSNILLANLLRRIGRLEQSREYFSKQSGLHLPVNNVTPTNGMTDGDHWIAPITMIDDFLPDARMAALFDHACALENEFSVALVGMEDAKMMPGRRQTLATANFQVEYDFFLKYVPSRLRQLQNDLGLPHSEQDTLEIKMSCHTDGGFFHIHTDNAGPVTEAGRAITWLYYFSDTPPRHEGGELVVFDTDIDRRKGSSAWFTKIEPKANRFIAFPSWHHHAVLPTRTHDAAFSSGRFAIGGHVHKPADGLTWPVTRPVT